MKKLSWKFLPALSAAVERYGNENLCRSYLAVVRAALEELAAGAGYQMPMFEGYYCGHGKCISHYWLRLEKSA